MHGVSKKSALSRVGIYEVDVPELAQVLGTIWSTVKAEDLDGMPMLMIQPLGGDQKPSGRPLVAVDTIGVGPGELVLFLTAYEAVIATGRTLIPVDAAIVGKVDSMVPEISS